MIRSADYIIIGGGTAGAVIARRLSDAGAETIVVEAGPTAEHDERVTVLRRYPEMLESELDFDYRTEAGGTRGNDLMRYPQARVLGGCSAHNTCIAFRAPDWDLQDWAASGAAGWGPAGCAPYFDRVFSMVNIEGAPTGHPWAEAFIAAGESYGLPVTDLGQRNVRSGVGYLKQNRRGELRESSAAAYLFPLSERPGNLRILTNETVLRIVLDDRGDAVGVDTSSGRILARQEVILCGGTFGTTKALMLSGIGPADHLRDVGIDVKVDLPGVGEHMVDHPNATLVFEANGTVSDELTIAHMEAAIFSLVEGGADYPEVMIHLDTLGYDQYSQARGYPTASSIFAMHPNVARARSEGTVRLRSADPAAQVVINTGFFTDPDGYDERIMLEGIRLTREIAAQPALAQHIKRELAPGPDLVSDAELSEYGRTTGTSVCHPAGTCKMGGDDDPFAVVNSDLQVRGVGRLRVADASVFPTITTVNPCLTVMMVGERCSEVLLAAASSSTRGV